MPHAVPGRLHRVRAGVIITLFAGAVVAAAAMGWWYAARVPAPPGSNRAHRGGRRPHQPAGHLRRARSGGAGHRRAGAGFGGVRARVHALAADAAGERVDPLGTVAHRARGPRRRGIPRSSPISGPSPSSFGTVASPPAPPCRRSCCGASRASPRGSPTSIPIDPSPGPADGVVLDRDGLATVEAAERWLRDRGGRRFFLFVQVRRRRRGSRGRPAGAAPEGARGLRARHDPARRRSRGRRSGHGARRGGAQRCRCW